LYDLLTQAKQGADPRLFLSWYSAGFCSDPNFANLPTPEERANPSLAKFTPGYLAQQQRRLPSARYRRLHLNLGGSPEGAAYAASVILDLIPRGISRRPPQPGMQYVGFVDMSGGSNDDSSVAIAHRDDINNLGVLDLVDTQGGAPPFNPLQAAHRFIRIVTKYGITQVFGDRYSGLTYAYLFAEAGIEYVVSALTASELYEALEPALNSRQVTLLDQPELESQLCGLVWRGGKIDHHPSEHDDLANSAAGALLLALDAGPGEDLEQLTAYDRALMAEHAQHFGLDPQSIHPDFVADDTGNNYADRDMRWSRQQADGSVKYLT
jgi:hypothetical protein